MWWSGKRESLWCWSYGGGAWKVEEIKRVSDGVMAALLFFEEDVLRRTWRYGLQSGRNF